MKKLKNSIYLLKVPEQQKTWFDLNYGFINDDVFPTDGAEWDRFKNNIFGDDDRFLNYNGNSNSLLDGFWLGYSSGGKSTTNTKYFLDCSIMAMKDAVNLEYYEIAFNIKIIHKTITRNINKAELYLENYPSFDGEL